MGNIETLKKKIVRFILLNRVSQIRLFNFTILYPERE